MRPGNAGANTAADKIAVVLDAALQQLPKRVAAREQVLVRADSAGATHELIDFCRDGPVRLLGRRRPDRARAGTAILELGEDAWVPALTQDGVPRDDGAWVAEITEQLDLSAWPAGSRVIVRREVGDPGAQMTFTDHDGHRFQAVLTDQPDADIAYLEARHRGHARVEDRIKAGKDTGMAKLPFRDFAMNAVWLELSLIAQDLIAWTKALTRKDLARCDPERLRYQLLHTAGRLAFHARQAVLHLDRDWPWANELAVAFARLQALPAPNALTAAPPRPTPDRTPADPTRRHRRARQPLVCPKTHPHGRRTRPPNRRRHPPQAPIALTRTRSTHRQPLNARSGLARRLDTSVSWFGCRGSRLAGEQVAVLASSAARASRAWRAASNRWA